MLSYPHCSEPDNHAPEAAWQYVQIRWRIRMHRSSDRWICRSFHRSGRRLRRNLRIHQCWSRRSVRYSRTYRERGSDRTRSGILLSWQCQHSGWLSPVLLRSSDPGSLPEVLLSGVRHLHLRSLLQTETGTCRCCLLQILLFPALLPRLLCRSCPSYPEW